MPFTMKPVRPLLMAALLLGAVWFLFRGPWRGAAGGNFDFALIYSAARAWLLGLDPYSMEIVQRVYLEAGGPDILEPATRAESSLVYSPATFAVLAPIAALPWAAANIVWTVINLLCLLAGLAMITRLARLGRTASLGLWAAMLWLAPAATGLYVGQLSNLVFAMIVGGELLRRRLIEAGPAGTTSGSFTCGLLLGFAAIVKPQMGLLFLVYETGRLRWRTAVGGLAGMALLLGLGAGRLGIAGVPWFSTWLQRLHDFSTVGDASLGNKFRYQMINLAYPLNELVREPALATTLVFIILGFLSLAYFIIDLRRGRQAGEGRGEMLSLSMTALVTLLIAYHRAYDAVLLAFPLALAARGLFEGRHDTDEPPRRWPRRWQYALVLLLITPLLAPGAGLLWAARRHGYIPEALADTLFWQAFILPHAPWALLLLCGWIVFLRARTAPDGSGASTAVQSTP